MFFNKEKWLDKYPGFKEIADTRSNLMTKSINYHNKYIAPLEREEDTIRDNLIRLTTEERVVAEQRIKEITETIKNDTEYQTLEKEYENADNQCKEYIKNKFTYEDKVNKLHISPYVDDYSDLFTEEEYKRYDKYNNIFPVIIMAFPIIIIILAVLIELFY